MALLRDDQHSLAKAWPGREIGGLGRGKMEYHSVKGVMEMNAFRIVDWWKFELLKNGKLATEKTKMNALRIKPLVYVRFPIHGHILTADYRRMVKRAGPEMAAACDGVYKMLVGLAGNQVREYRGWILDDRQRPLNPGQIAELLCLSEEKVRQIFEILLDSEVNWVDFLDLAESLHKSLNGNDLSDGSQKKKSGNNQENLGSALNEVETKRFSKDKFKRIRSESEEGEFGKKRDREGNEREENVQPQPQPAQPSAPGSGSGTVPASDSEKTSVPASDSASVPDSFSQAGRAGAGADGPGPLTGMKRFNMYQERNDAEKKVMRILKVNLNNRSDTTTICDIYEQFANRLIRGDTTYPLFEHSLNTARQCWRAKNQIAMFVSAMKEPPFSYDPVKRSVIPGKFSQDRCKN